MLSISPTLPFWIALSLAIVAAILAFRRAGVRSETVSFAMGSLLLAVACADVRFHLHHTPTVTVLIDDSASTRSAAFHDPHYVDQRLRELLGDATHTLSHFSDPTAEQTDFIPPPAEALLLFSDGQFNPPTLHCPAWCVIDSELDNAKDAAIESVDSTDPGLFSIHTRNSGDLRQITLNNWKQPLITGRQILSAPATQSGMISVNPGDRWPENDSLPTPPAQPSGQRWWIGANAPPGWIARDLPQSLSDYSAASVIAIADANLDESQALCLNTFVLKLGGSLLDLHTQAVAARDSHVADALDPILPLTRHPPNQPHRWLIWIDASGSMAQLRGNISAFDSARAQLPTILRKLPAADRASIGFFARDFHPRLTDQSVAELAAANLNDMPVSPSGPTNLQPLLLQWLAADPITISPTDLMLFTDAQATLDRTEALASQLAAHHVRLSVISDNPSATLAHLCDSTGGQFLRSDVARWSVSTDHLLNSQLAEHHSIVDSPTQFVPALHLPVRIASSLDGYYLRQSASPLATAGPTSKPVAAEWNVGSGRVLSLRFTPSPAELNVLAVRLDQPLLDPNLQIDFTGSDPLTLRILAIDNHTFLNDQSFTLLLDDQSPLPIPQTAPGEYQLSFPAAKQETIATLYHAAAPIRRFVLPARYPREFDRIGVNRPLLSALCSSTGGRLIEPADHHPLDFSAFHRDIPLRSILASAGALLLALSLLHSARLPPTHDSRPTTPASVTPPRQNW